ncbi:glycosyltransferase family 4 protein [Alphaproteobacteria bacterium LMG 31809]|uniref:Glycosyltransferase family 4 protein n=1 Tax=Govanella unica TaxID=2975056 RepID=A0A9X3TXP0_9PROT|nr:glycosyltransferase family 4 protein [Govania unica]MDA5193583.1 glycosyltransferase family 4 protein [Govania unica]
MKILTFSSLFPNVAMPSFGVFVENRLRHLVESGEVEARVVAPVPWCPGAYKNYQAAPAQEIRHGIEVVHPRYLTAPGIGMYIQPWTLYRAALPVLRRIIRDGYDFDLIDAHYFYPDGVAATWLGKALGKPVVITSRGTDLTLIPNYGLPRRLIQQGIKDADGLITVSGSLRDKLLELGAPVDKPRVLRNGVDLGMFQPLDREAIRARLGITGTTLLSVGYLIPRKGNEITVGALPDLPDVTLLLAGTGEDEGMLRKLAADLGVADRVRFLGAVAHHDLADYYNAADILVLASSREGMANVLLEAIACGTPIVGSPIPGMDEVVDPPESGVIMTSRTPKACAEAVAKLLANMPDRAATRAYAESLSWDATTKGQLDLFRDILAKRPDGYPGQARV